MGFHGFPLARAPDSQGWLPAISQAEHAAVEAVLRRQGAEGLQALITGND